MRHARVKLAALALWGTTLIATPAPAAPASQVEQPEIGRAHV